MFFLLYFLIKLCANFGDWADFEWSPGFFRFKSQLWKIICLDYIRFWRQSNVNFSFSWLFIDLLMIMKIWGSPKKIWGSPIKIWGSPIQIWGSRTKFWGSPTNIWCPNENLGVSNKKMGVSNENLGVSNDDAFFSDS